MTPYSYSPWICPSPKIRDHRGEEGLETPIIIVADACHGHKIETVIRQGIKSKTVNKSNTSNIM